MRQTCLNKVHALARIDPRVVFIGSDLGVGTLSEMATEFPSRTFMEGVNEANCVGTASGLASEGFVVYFNTLAAFIVRRAYEQVCLDLGHADLPVRLIGNGGGLVYAPLGPTHEPIEDIALMRAVPNMSVVCCADRIEMEQFMDQTLDWPHPIYIRLAKGHDPIVTEGAPPFVMGKARVFGGGRDALIVTTGITLGLAQQAQTQLKERGVDAGILHFPTIKPFDTEALLEAAGQTAALVTVEEHSLVGGLGSVVAETVIDSTLTRPPRVKRIGIPDQFPDVYGSQKSQLARYDITSERVVAETHALLKNE